MACRNPELAHLRAHKRQALLAATTQELERVRGMVARGRLTGQDAIGVRVGKVVNKYKVAKHIRLDIRADAFAFQVDAASVAAEAALDGLYVLRTSVPTARLDADETVRSYKRLSQVERAFRALKTVDLKVRPDPPPARGRGSAPTSSSACWPTTSSGTCARPGARSCSPMKTKPPRRPATPWRRPRGPRRPYGRSTRSSSTTGRWSTASARCSRS